VDEGKTVCDGRSSALALCVEVEGRGDDLKDDTISERALETSSDELVSL
jgi:hypothetical protein